MPAILETRNLTKVFGSFTAVSDVSLAFETGKIHAVLGENGAGKSTLLKLLFGLHHPTSGEILLDGEAVTWRDSMDAISRGLGMVQQHFSLVEPLSAIDNIMLGAEVCDRSGRLNRKAAIEKIEKLLPGPQLAVPWDTPVAELGVGFRQRVEILKLLFREARVLFLDEPTAVLTPQEIQDFFNILRLLKNAGKTIVLITHKIGEVFQICDTYSVLRHGKLISRGSVADVSPDKLVEGMIGRKLAPLSEVRTPSRDESVLEFKNVLESTAGRGALRGVDLNVRAGEIVGIAGIDGSGQSSLVDAVMGLKKFSGDIEVLGSAMAFGDAAEVRRRGVGLVPEDRNLQGLWGEESCHHNMIIGLEKDFLRHGLLHESEISRETTKWAKEFDVRAPSLENEVGSLSGGNQQKVIFAREVVGRKPKLLLCHQPTRGVDLGAIELIHSRLLKLRDSGLGILLISSEIDELLQLSDRIYVLYEGEIAGEFIRGDFDRMKIGAAMTGTKA